MPHMLAMPALQPGCPMPFFILIKTHYGSLHRTPSSNIK
jgi:hypothetical protein